MQVVARVREAFGVEVGLRRFFEQPTVAALAGAVEKGLREGRGVQWDAIAVAARDAEVPLSFAQERLWFLDQLKPGGGLYNVPAAIRLVGKLKVAELRRSFKEVGRRHEALRTTFAAVEGRPRQVIAAVCEVVLPLIDLSLLDGGARERDSQRLAAEEARRAFDLERGPLWRMRLLKLDAEEHLLLLTMHHIVSDGWSMGVLVRELTALYAAFVGGKPAPLVELPIQYADYSVWQRGWLQGEVLEEQLSYWRGQLVGVSALELPTDRPRSAARTLRGGMQQLQLSGDLSQSLKRVSQREGVTLFMTLLAGFKALLYRYTGQEDIVVGIPIAGRSRVETENLIGFFVNTLVLRTSLSGNRSFQQILGQVKEVTLGAYAHQDLPFEKLVEELHPERDMDRTPLFQVMFVLQNTPQHATQETEVVSGLKLSAVGVESGTAKFDLTLSLAETEQALRAGVEYNADLFDAAMITRMMGHFQTMLAGAVADPHRPLSRLPLLSEEERRQVLVEWNRTERAYPRQSSIHHLFEQQAVRTPEAIALVSGRQQMTYAELNERANRLARYLRARGVGPESLVGLFMERTPELIVALLGVLKADGAYLPLEVGDPPARLAQVLQDAGAQHVITQSWLAQQLPDETAGENAALAPQNGPRPQLLCLDSDWGQVMLEEATAPASRATGEYLAYLMYTSGSTGRPKPIAVPHRAISRLVINTDYVQLTPADRVAQASNTSFDAATFEVWGALLNGARLVLLSKEVMTSPEEFAREVGEQGISAMFLTTALFNQLASEVPWAFKTIRHVLVGGEAASPVWMREVLERGSPERLLNAYGPTETTTFAVWKLLERVAEGAARVPIGRPLANTQVYALDGEMEPVPVGVSGELYIGGDGLARGYAGRPALTAERFVPHLYSAEPGQRLYRTGDLVRWQADGELDFLGRTDNQVKLRGFRIELGEIEAALNQHPAVKEAVVAVPQSEDGDKRLVAYLVCWQEGVSTVELREYLGERLPGYMVPAVYVVLPELPLTMTGKVDRRALPAPPQAASLSDDEVPRPGVEELVGQIWCEVLGVERVGRTQDFFTLGGHSLAATRVVSRVRSVFGVELPLRRLFEEPTVEGLAAGVAQALRGDERFAVPPMRPAPRDRSLPLSFAQSRLWFLDQFLPGSPFYNVPAAVRLTGELDVAALAQVLNEIVRRHETLRTTFAVVDGQPVQVIAPALPFNMPLVELGEVPEPLREARVRKLVRAEAQRPFDLGRGPLFRVTLLRLGREEHVVLLTLHHIVADGWSMGVLIRELAALYEAIHEAQPSPLPPLPIQYADFAFWQRQWLEGEVLEAQLAYWRRQLAGAPPLLELPTDRPRSAAQARRGAVLPLTLPQALSQDLKALSRREGVTLFMTLLAAFQTLLHRYTGQDDIIVGSPIANRNRIEIEGLIGFFVNMLVFRTDLSGNPTFKELLRRAQEVSLGAYSHQDLPFEVLVSELQLERDLSHTPLVQVVFTLQNAPLQPPSLSGLTLSLLGSDIGTAKFDLNISLNDMGPELNGMFEYNADLFEEATVALMLEHFQTLLEGVVAQPERPVLEIPLARGGRESDPATAASLQAIAADDQFTF
jgi:amino acid adenylation domain-containing protein